MSMSIKIDSKDVEDELKKIKNLMEKIVPSELEKLGQDIEKEAKRIVPVRTGFLRSSIYHKKTGKLTLEVGASAPYAIYVEYGTSRMSPKPYLRPAIMKYFPKKFIERIIKALR